MASIAATTNVQPSSSHKNITCIDGKLYKAAAVEGNFNEFTDVHNIERLLAPLKNTILHIHLTSTTSDTTTVETAPSFTISYLLVVVHKIVRWILSYKRIETAVSEHFVEQTLDKCGRLVLLRNTNEETPLHVAARYGHLTIAKMLIERAKALPRDIESGVGEEKKLIRATTHENNDTALHEAVRYNHIKVVEILLEMDPDHSNIANKANETTLYLASEREYTQ